MGFPMVLFLWVFGCCFSDSVIAKEKRVGGLELHFYEHRCLNDEMIVKELTKTSMLTDPTTAASLLRMAFHDCQVDVSLSLSLARLSVALFQKYYNIIL